MIEYAQAKYFSDFSGSRETISIHFRLMTESEPNPGKLRHRPQAAALWYLHLMEIAFDPTKVVFFVFSEDPRVVMPMLMNVRARIPSFKYVMVDEDFATSLVVMSMCKHHIVADSTFSFWGMRKPSIRCLTDARGRCVSRQEARR
jgi:hypothetical protein